MCTVVILRRPHSRWPLLVAANRDEMVSRRCRPPARHWPARPRVVAGLDELAGGTWLGINDDAVVAGILNRLNTLGPVPGLKSRGELPLCALDHASARRAVEFLGKINPNEYRPFNMIVADSRQAFWIRCRQSETGEAGANVLESGEIPLGLSMITAYDRNDTASPRIRRYLGRFEAAKEPDPNAGDWEEWKKILKSREHDPESGPGGAICVVTDYGFGTVSSSLIALPDQDGRNIEPIWLFSADRPGESTYEPVDL